MNAICAKNWRFKVDSLLLNAVIIGILEHCQLRGSAMILDRRWGYYCHQLHTWDMHGLANSLFTTKKRPPLPPLISFRITFFSNTYQPQFHNNNLVDVGYRMVHKPIAHILGADKNVPR